MPEYDEEEIRRRLKLLSQIEPSSEAAERAVERTRISLTKAQPPQKQIKSGAWTIIMKSGWTKVGAAIAAVIVAAVVLAVVYLFSGGSFTDGSLATVDVARGESVLTMPDGAELPLAVGSTLIAGEGIRVGLASGVHATLVDGTSLWLCEGAEAVFRVPRSSDAPTVALLRGELRADVVTSVDTFSVETPAATLRVLGTEFHSRVFPALYGGDHAMQRVRDALQKAVPWALAVTVLTGSVAVEAADTQQVVHAGERTVVMANAGASEPEAFAGTEYVRDWLGEPGERVAPEALVFVPIREALLHGMWAVNVETGDARYIGAFVGAGPQIVGRFGPDLALVNAGSVIFAHFGDQPISGSGRPFVNDQIMLVNLNTGEKIPMTPLREYDPLYLELSPDRRQLAFCGSRTLEETGEREHGVFVLDLETLKVERVLKGAVKTCPHWSPDSRWLAISTAEGYQHDPELHKIVLIDTLTCEVIETSLLGAGVHFTPDGTRLLYSGGFTRSGSFSAGVPTWGNLFLADVPDGTPERLTSLPDGGAIQPSFSPDGTKLLYWEANEPARPHLNEPARLHLLDLGSRLDRVIAQGNPFGKVEWLDENSRILVTGDERSGQPLSVRIITLTGEDVAVEEFAGELPEPSSDLRAAGQNMAERLMDVFRTYREAADAQDMHRIDESVVLFGKARDLTVALAEELETGEGRISAGLRPGDLRAYVEKFDNEAAMTPDERSVKVVRENLRWYVSTLFNNYYRRNEAIPATIDDLARWALENKWQINHVSSGDTERVRRLFVVPGDDPSRVTTSYDLVHSDETNRKWVLRTPVLANGARLEATYLIQGEGRGARLRTDVVEIQ